MNCLTKRGTKKDTTFGSPILGPVHIAKVVPEQYRYVGSVSFLIDENLIDECLLDECT